MILKKVLYSAHVLFSRNKEEKDVELEDEGTSSTIV